MTTFSVVVYNIMVPVPPPIRIYGQTERAQRVKDVIRDLDQEYQLDVVILNEVIAPEAQSIVCTDMVKLGFPYRTKKLSEVFTAVSGGIIVFSKHPITQEACTIFGDKCTGTDCLAAKGVAYARIEKGGAYYNVFGTHLQAWPSVKAHAARDRQIHQTLKLIKSLQIPKDEAVIFAGDMNTDLYHNRDYIRHIAYKLDMEIPVLHPDSHPFTVDPRENKLVGNDDPSEYATDDWPNGCAEQYYETLECPCCPAEWIDYTMFSKTHLRPTESSMRAIKAKVVPFRMKINAWKEVEVQDVSDHFPVLGRFVFDAVQKPADRFARISDHPRKLELDTNSNTVVIAVIIAVVGVIVLVVGVLAVRRHRQKARAFPSQAYGVMTL